jgi:hypothetical protein
MSSRERLEFKRKMFETKQARIYGKNLLNEAKKQSSTEGSKSDPLELAYMKDSSVMTHPILDLGTAENPEPGRAKDTNVSFEKKKEAPVRMPKSKEGAPPKPLDPEKLLKSDEANVEEHKKEVEEVLKLKEVLVALIREELQEAKKKVKTYKGKSMRLGGGGRFAKMVDALVRKGYSKKSAKSIAAKIGRDTYGKQKMAQWAAAGKKRKAKKEKVEELRLTFES